MIDREALIQKLRDLFYSYQDSSDGDALEEAIEILSAPALASQEGAQAGEVVAEPVAWTNEETLARLRAGKANIIDLAPVRRDWLTVALYTTPPAPDDAVRVELEAYRAAAEYDALMEGPKFRGWNLSRLERARKLTECARKGGVA